MVSSCGVIFTLHSRLGAGEARNPEMLMEQRRSTPVTPALSSQSARAGAPGREHHQDQGGSTRTKAGAPA